MPRIIASEGDIFEVRGRPRNYGAKDQEFFTVDGTSIKLGGATTDLIAFWGVNPVGQQSTTGTSAGFTAGSTGAVFNDSTFTGNTGTTAYRIGDVVLALKNVGILKA